MGLPEPVVDMQLEMYKCSIEFGCVTLMGLTSAIRVQAPNYGFDFSALPQWSTQHWLIS